MNIFDIVPIGFFNPLASGSNNRIYADCLQVIYNEYDREITFACNKQAMRFWVLQYGPYVEILAPEELRESIKADIEGMMKRYSYSKE